MRTVALGDIAEIKGGGTPDKKNPKYWDDGDISWATVKDFKSSKINSTVDKITMAGVENSATRIVPAGTILVPTRMAVGKVAISGIDLAINQDLKAIFPNIEVCQKYLFHALWANGHVLERQAGGATVKGITLPVLKALKIPLPPLPEQKRIAAILDQADALRRQRQRALDQLSQLGQSIFHEMFGSPVAALNKLPNVGFSEALNDVTRTVSKVPKEEYETAGKLPIIDQGKNYIAGWCNLTVDMKVSPAGRIIFGDHTRKVDFISQRFVAGADGVKVLDSREGFEKRFLADLLRFMPIDDLGYSRHMKVLKSARYIKPDKNKQVEYVEKINNIEQANEPIIHHLHLVDSLFSSLQQRAFRGEL